MVFVMFWADTIGIVWVVITVIGVIIAINVYTLFHLHLTC